ncbi:MAG: class I SAM-dependent methyltransferase [Spirochaetota bacterium]
MNNLFKVFTDIKKIILSDDFFKKIDSDKIDSLKEYIYLSLFEAEWGLTLLSRYDLINKQVLEIGSGAGIVSATLQLYGANVTMVEPSDGVFSHQNLIASTLLAHLGIHIPVINEPIENIQPASKYDFIFSINVLEHVNNVSKAFEVMSQLLKNDGIMFHTCPNYIVPYEPHVGVLLFPFFPRATYAFSRKLRTHPVSTMLNFITVPQITRLAHAHNFTVQFASNLMYQSFLRFEYDSQFKKRQQALYWVYRVLKKTHLLGMTRYIPVCLQSPVAFEMRKKQRTM